MKKRLLGILLLFVITLTLLPMTAFAEGEGGTSLGTTKTACKICKKITTFDMLEFIRSPISSYDPDYHWVRAKCTECGNEQEFVNQMNERAKGLGMENTHFINCNGLDAEGHVTTARDIALMSRELIHTYPQIFDYCNIWMEDITHTTKKGSTQFGLTNTNKMIRQYEYATGLKTGSTSQAKFCISATARKDNTDMIAVIMAADDSKARMRDAITLLNYGFGKCQKYQEDTVKKIQDVPVKHGVEKKVGAAQMELFSYVDVTGADLSTIKKIVKLKENATAPVRQGDKIGEVIYSLNGKEIGKVDILATEDVEEISYGSAMKEAVRGWTL